MKELSCDISIADFNYKGVVNLSIESSSELLTDNLVITFPRKVNWNDKSIKDLIKRNDKVIVNIGYDENLIKEFEGYVRTVKADIPVTVNCEDSMFLLKNNAVKTSFQQTSLDNLLKTILPTGFKYKSSEINLGKIRINNATPAEVLKNLKDKYGIYSFFKGDTLYSGLQYWNEGKNHIFNYTIDNFKNLEYRTANDIKFKVTAISILEDNSKLEVTRGDADGEQRTYHYFNVDKKELERRANSELEKLKYDGYYGSFLVFGSPSVEHGDTVTIKNEEYPEREGTYIVKSVTKPFGQIGFRQTITIDRLWS